ncbi:MAG: hypothetical protein AB2L24_00930 [Mangrovibacterium sp.]
MKKCEKGASLRGDWLFNLQIKHKRKIRYFWKPAVLLCVVLWVCGGCQKQDWFESDESGVGLPVEEARTFFENDVVGITTRSTERDKAYYTRRFMLPVGDITPQWGKGVSTKGKRLLSVDVPVETTYRYRGVWTDPATGKKQTVSCYHELVVIKNTETGKMDSYIVFFIGDAGYSKSHKGDISKRFNNGGNMGDFTGVKIYTRLDGRIARVNKYKDGRKVGGVFIGGATEAKDYTRRFVSALNMMKHLAVQQGVRKNLKTRPSDE